MERVVKGFTGYGKEKEGKQATHVILNIDEYNSLMKDISQAKNETQRTIEKAKSEMADYKKKADNLISLEKQDSQKRIEAIQSDFNKSQMEIHRLNDLNANLLRIMRERANSRRGVKPKKNHHGYIILDSSQQNYVFRYLVQGRTYSDEYPCWKVRVQSPYDCSIPYETIKKNIERDLLSIFGSSLGVKSVYSDISKLNHESIKEMWDEDKNFIFKTSYKANMKACLWEVEYLVKSSVTISKELQISGMR